MSELLKYAVNEAGTLVYVGHGDKQYRVWGVGEFGLLHGTGAYLSYDEDCAKQGLNRGFIFDKPTFDEIEQYYKNIDKFYRGLRGED